jgi:hypothetical protein
VSTRRTQNTIKTTVASDADGRPMRAGATRPQRMYDKTALCTEGIDMLMECSTHR